MGLPEPPKGHKWCRVVDTNLASPKDFTPGGNAGGSGKQQRGRADRQMLLTEGDKGMASLASADTLAHVGPCVPAVLCSPAGVDPVYFIQAYSAILLIAKPIET